MSFMPNVRSGFTIVELLIVIVVIAILATVSIVAYRGIQDRANDTAVQSDITNFVKKIKLARAESGDLPAGGGAASPAGVGKFSLAQGSYSTSTHNFYYCVGTVSGIPQFAVGAVSKSGNKYYYSSEQGSLGTYSGAWSGSTNICPGMLPGVDSGWTYTHGYNNASGWNSWTQ